MASFDFKKTEIANAVEISALLPHGLMKFLRIAFLAVAPASLLLYLLSLLGNEKTVVLGFARPSLAGLTYLLFAFGLSSLLFEIYFDTHLSRPPIKNVDNIAEFLDFDSAKTVVAAARISRSLKEDDISTNALLLALLNNSLAGTVFLRLGIVPSDFKKQVFGKIGDWPSFRLGLASLTDNYSQELLSLLADANQLRIDHGGERISVMDFIVSLFDYNEIFRQKMIEIDIDKSDLGHLAVWFEHLIYFDERRRRFWEIENIMQKPPVGISWVYGYSNLLNHFSIDLTRPQIGLENLPALVGRKTIVGQIEEILARARESNVLLIGEAGVGKKTIVNEFARLVANGKSSPQLNRKRVLELNVPLVTSSSKEPIEVQNVLVGILNEAIRAGNIILVINDFHNFIGGLGGMGRVDISGVIMPYLESSDIQIIATTNPVSFHKLIESQAEFMKVFERVDVPESSVEETIGIVEAVLPGVEAQNGVMFPYPTIKKIVQDADRYIKTVPFPEKALDLLSQVLSHAKAKKSRVITGEDVDEVVTQKTNIPLGKISGGERSKLVNLEVEMHKDIIGQDEAVKAVAQTMRRLRAGLVRRNKPAGVFLFVGPTGVGKTQTAKILAKTYFGSESKMIRFDMSEYQDVESIDRFLGSLRLNEPGQLASAVRDNPFSLVLLDEIEKANKNILNIFLQVFDEGRLTDVFGRKVSFEENIIIATSNAGADVIRDMVNQGIDPSIQKEKVIDVLVGGHYFNPEFLNRFDEVVIYHPLTQEQISTISGLLMNALTERLRQQGYFFKPTPEITEFVSKIGFDPQFGARPMQRVIQDRIESVIAKKILNQEVSKGKEFTLTLEEVR